MKNISIFALLLVITLGACKKDGDTDPKVVVPPVAKRLTGYTYENNSSNPVSIKYDASGRVIEFTDGEDTQTNTYTGNELRIIEFRKSENREVFNFKGTLNAQGNVVSGTALSTYNSSSPQILEYTFEYNADGYLTKNTRISNNGASVYSTVYTYSNGNMVSEKTYVDGVLDYGGTWEYDTSKPNKNGLNSYFTEGNTFCGKANKNLAVKYTASSGWFANITYSLDSEGYMQTSTTSYSNGNGFKLFYTFK